MSEFLKNRYGIVISDNTAPASEDVQLWLDSLPRGRSARCAGCGRFICPGEHRMSECPTLKSAQSGAPSGAKPRLRIIRNHPESALS